MVIQEGLQHFWVFTVAPKGPRLLQPHSTWRAFLATAPTSPRPQLTLSHATKAGKELLETRICLFQRYLCSLGCIGGLYAVFHQTLHILLQGSYLPLHSFH